jgi:hypothetical protein
MQRPNDRDRRVLDYVARELTRQILEYDPLENGPGAATEDDIQVKVREALDICRDWDGFELGQQLDRDWGCIDSGYVDILDNAVHLQIKKHDELVREWVAQNNIQPQFSWGDEIFTLSWNDDLWRRVPVRGTIVEIRREMAQYTITFDPDPMRALHTSPERHFFATGTIFNYEDVF